MAASRAAEMGKALFLASEESQIIGMCMSLMSGGVQIKVRDKTVWPDSTPQGRGLLNLMLKKGADIHQALTSFIPKRSYMINEVV